MQLPFTDRREAGRALGEALTRFAGRDDVVVLGLPRGGVPVAYEVAKRLNAPLDVLVVRKLGVPGYEELAMGAVASGGVRILNEEVVRRLGVRPAMIDEVIERETCELERREQIYRGPRPYPVLADRCVILVDDGLATGSTMRAAVRGARLHDVASVVVAVPVASPEAERLLSAKADEVVCLATPEEFTSVGQWYKHFEQVPDDQVQRLLEPATPSSASG